MSDNYISVNFSISPIYPGSEILIAELSELDFEMFEEHKTGVIAYVKSKDFQKKLLSKIRLLKSKEFNISYSINSIKDKNWNEQWEKNYKAVEITSDCIVRAPFHKISNKKYDIIIMPEMSFGTGHHETTQLMIEYILESELKNLRVSDIGSGTGILSILSEKKGASKVDAVDIDRRSYINSRDNLKRNKCKRVFVTNSSSDSLLGNKYDLILCNINLNLLISNFKNFAHISTQNTTLIVSGFYRNDLDLVNIELKKNNFHILDFKEKNNWISAKYYYSSTPR